MVLSARIDRELMITAHCGEKYAQQNRSVTANVIHSLVER
jgi:hypothetical protein